MATNTNNRKKVVVVGAGFAGTGVASALDKHKDTIDLTLITKRDGFMLSKFGGLRSAVANGNWVARTLVPLHKLMKNGKLVHGTVVEVDAQAKLVKLEDGTSVPYDILVLAVGSRNFSPAEAPAGVSTKAETEAYYTQMHAALATAKSVCIIGAGPVAIELAGELKEFGQKDVKVTLISRANQVLHPTPLTKSNIQTMQKFLEQEHVEVIYNDEVVSETFPTDVANSSPLVHTPEGVKLKSGKEVKCDLLVYALGSKVTTQFLPKEWLDPKTGEVLVDEKTLKLTGHDNIFCVGDAAKTNYTKLAYIAEVDSAVVAANVLQVVQGKAPTHKVQRYSMMMLIPFGPHKGRVLLPFANLGNFWARTIKGKGLFTNRTWSMVAPGLTPPPAS